MAERCPHLVVEPHLHLLLRDFERVANDDRGDFCAGPCDEVAQAAVREVVEEVSRVQLDGVVDCEVHEAAGKRHDVQAVALKQVVAKRPEDVEAAAAPLGLYSRLEGVEGVVDQVDGEPANPARQCRCW